MVNIIEDWDVLEEYAGEKLGFYQLLATDGKIEIRQTGRVGFKREFEKGDDPILNKILDFCRKQRYIRVSEHSETKNSSNNQPRQNHDLQPPRIYKNASERRRTIPKTAKTMRHMWPTVCRCNKLSFPG